MVSCDVEDSQYLSEMAWHGGRVTGWVRNSFFNLDFDLNLHINEIILESYHWLNIFLQIIFCLEGLYKRYVKSFSFFLSLLLSAKTGSDHFGQDRFLGIHSVDLFKQVSSY